MYLDPSGEFAIIPMIIGVLILASSIQGAIKAYQTAKSLGSTGWGLCGYTISGLVVGDYLPVKDNWDSISQTIEPNTELGNINFDFDVAGNKYYSSYTAGLYAAFLKNGVYATRNDRTEAGMYIELQFHYFFYRIDSLAGNIFNNGSMIFGNGNPALLGVSDWNGDWTAALSEFIAELINGLSGISPIS
jgi:hypothetical protein